MIPSLRHSCYFFTADFWLEYALSVMPRIRARLVKKQSRPTEEAVPFRTSPIRFISFLCLSSVRFRPVDHSMEVHEDHRLVADDPCVMPRGDENHIARFTINLGAVIHMHTQHTRDLILEVLHLAAQPLGDRFDRCRPSPTRLKRGSAHRGSIDRHQFHLAVGELPHFFRFVTAFPYCSFHKH